MYYIVGIVNSIIAYSNLNQKFYTIKLLSFSSETFQYIKLKFHILL